ncbi:MAG: hypothetical protein IPK91_01235 [Saprospiraceae bacterium]|jgi:hypothetical protein|nr:hypothetical protein [Saprospiraceae bacterium]MBK8295919.1 hypothetical protein [Saprospiraceae bacterium]
MRILGQIPHPELLITVFKSGNKLIIKFEIGPFEQTYKFLETDKLSNFEDAVKLVTETWIQDVYQLFNSMNATYKIRSHEIS